MKYVAYIKEKGILEKKGVVRDVLVSTEREFDTQESAFAWLNKEQENLSKNNCELIDECGIKLR